MIAIDAMGGDYAPQALIEGALNAARKGIPVKLFGDKVQLIVHLGRLDSAWKKYPISFVHCTQVIRMADEPGTSVLRKKDSSLVRAVRAVANNQAQAVVSAGNSGAALAAGTTILGRVPGVLRPAIGGFLPTRKGLVFCIDLGANINCKPENLYQFALMGDTYVRLAKNIESPRIALLANGTESTKGIPLIQEAHQLLTGSMLNFIGNREPTDIFNDVADVIVCEGFSGNIMLKSIEATVQVLLKWIRSEYDRSLMGKLVGLLGKPVFRRLKKNINKAQKGGALLLGVNQPLVIAHGSSDAQAIEDAIAFAHHVCTSKFHHSFNTALADQIAHASTVRHVSAYNHSSDRTTA